MINTIGGIKYALAIIDREVRKLYTYPVRNLQEQSLKQAMDQFIIEIGGKPSRMIADRDQRLIGGAVADLLETPTKPTTSESNATIVSGAPDHCQSQNGLIKKAWQIITTMSQNWLASNRMPMQFWWFDIKYATQVFNYMPIKYKGSITTPHYLAYKKKPDYRNLFLIFSVAYVKRYKDGQKKRKKLKSQVVKCIVVGNNHKSDGRLSTYLKQKA